MKRHPHPHATTKRSGDASRDAHINAVRYADGHEVPWAEAFPRRTPPLTIPREA